MIPQRGTPVTSHRPCPVCHFQTARYLHRMHFALADTSPLPAHYDVLVCQRCGSGYADSATGVDAYDEYYRDFSKYEDTAVATGGGDEPMDRQRLADLAAFLAARIAPGARVLDVGCGNGGLMAALRKRGFNDLTGFDPAAACIARIKAQGMSAYPVSLPLTDPGAIAQHWGTFDLIVLSHALEHVFDAQAVVASLLPLLATSGRLYIETPDPTRYASEGFPPLYFFDPELINHLGAESLESLGTVLGLEPIVIAPKSLALANGNLYPAVFGLFETRDVPNAPPPDRGMGLYQPLLAYVEQGLADLAPMRARIMSLIGNDRPFALWGAGSLSQRLIGEPWFPAHRLRAVVDRDHKKQGLRFSGLIITSPETGLRDLPETTLILCAAAIATQAIKQDYLALQLPYPFYAIVN